jgi:sterol desaturase/sphingolipid hydroxylase (fatty acid hydroxylase superfamily)
VYHLSQITHEMSLATILGSILLVGSVVVTAVVSYLYSDEERSWCGFWRHSLPPETLRHPSARADIWFYISGKLTSMVVVVPGASLVVGIGVMVNRGLQHVVPWPPSSTAGSTGLLALFTLTMLVIHDLSYYLFHYMQHRVPILWELHKVHHSAEAMVGFTKYRIHPLDILIGHCWDGLFIGIIYGVWLFYACDPVESTIFGIDVYRFRNIVTLDFIRHTPYKISYGPIVSNILMSPHYHQLHHSVLPEHWNKNLSVGLSCWDWLFGTLMAPKPNEDFIFGLRLTDRESEEYHAWWRLYTVPLVKMSRMLIYQPNRAKSGQSVEQPVSVLSRLISGSSSDDAKKSGQGATVLRSAFSTDLERTDVAGVRSL